MAKPVFHLLKPGNGHQAGNRQVAMSFAGQHLGVVKVDGSTVEWPGVGHVHFSAYTSADGAMISTPAHGRTAFGEESWHAKGRTLMLRETGDGRLIAYLCSIEKLLDRRTIGHHGVTWTDVSRSAEKIVVFRLGADGEPTERRDLR